MNRKERNTASDIYRQIVYSQTLKGYTVIITGKTGPTGKSTLCRMLVNAGVNAIEISETLNMFVEYSRMNNTNHVVIDESNETVLVVLNRLRTVDK